MQKMTSLIDRGQRARPENCRRLMILGSSKVGKTSIIQRFLHNRFEDKYTPTVEDFHRKIYKIRGEAYRLDILDTSGNNPFPAMRRLSYMTGDLFILVYDITSRESFMESKQMLEDVQQTTNCDSRASIPILLVGNHCDQESDRTVHLSEAKELLGHSNAFFDVIDASAKLNINIDAIFVRLFEMAKLPTEMCQSLHRKVTPSYPGKSGRSRWLVCRKVSEACGVLQPNPRRPSVRADLSQAQKRGSIEPTSRNSRCVVQ